MSGPSIDEILEDYRNAGVGGHLVGGGVLRALCAEIDRLRERVAGLEPAPDCPEHPPIPGRDGEPVAVPSPGCPSCRKRVAGSDGR